MKNAAAIFLSVVLTASVAPAHVEDFIHFEGRQTHSVRLSADGERLFALNTADGRLSVFDVTNPAAPPLLFAEIPVGLEPVSLAERTADEIWVVNEVSDCVSIVSLSRRIVTKNLETGDEPADIVFADGKAFVTNARDNSVRVFDANSHEILADIPLQQLFPRALTVSEDSTKIYVAAQLSGNRTTILPPDQAPAPPAPTNPDLGPAPETGLIVHDSHPEIPFTVLDNDIAVIDVATLTVENYLEGAGTTLFNSAIRPGTEEIWVANTEALNHIRFEPVLRGHYIDNRVTKIDTDTGAATAYDLNPDIDYTLLPNPEAQRTALAQPTGIIFEPSGSHLWTTAFGSDIVARIDAASGEVVAKIDVGPVLLEGETSRSSEKRAPRDLALGSGGNRLFVLNRFTNSITTIDLGDNSILSEVPVGSVDPVPTDVKRGRGFLYDARLSGNGTNSCASCHIDGDRDGLAWDLGDPGGEMVYIEGENRANHDSIGPGSEPGSAIRALHPMKGPKVTQTLRGMLLDTIDVSDPTHVHIGDAEREPLFHWRGDKKTLEEFNGTFDALMGGNEITDAQFATLKTYLRSVKLHPNPYLNLDRSMPVEIQGGDPLAGQRNFFNESLGHCAVCHPGASGTDQNIDEFNISSTVDFIKTPPLMLSYQKQGTYTPTRPETLSGFGFGHDGTGRSLPLPHFYFLSTMDVEQLIDTRAFMLAFDSTEAGTAPVVGHILSVDATNATSSETAETLKILESHADPRQQANGLYWNDVAATGFIDGAPRKLYYQGTLDRWISDDNYFPRLTGAELLAEIGEGDLLHFAGLPIEYGFRIGGDRDQNGFNDGRENAPEIKLTMTPSGAEIDWFTIFEGWYLESSTDLKSWSPLNVPRSEETFNFKFLDPAPEASKYYKIRRSW